MSEWKEYKLGDVCSDINYGYTASANNNPIGPKFLRITDIVPERINWETVPYCEINIGNEKKYRLEKGDIVIARTGATTGYNAIIKEATNAVFASYLIRYRIKNKIANPFYIGYLLKSYAWKGFVQNVMSGSAQPGANAKQFADFDFELPPYHLQDEIVSILSSLDDKIDLLQRQNKTLEQLAETLFRQWFVEEAEEKAEREILLGDLIDTVSITHKLNKVEVIFLNTSDIYLGEVLIDSYSSVKSLPGQAKKSIQKDDILFSEIRPANGRWAYIDFDADEFVVSTKLMVLRSKGKINQAFVYFYLTHPMTVEWLSVLAESRSGTFPQITFDQLEDLKINVPSDKRLKEVEQWCSTTLYKIKKNNKQIHTLTQLRDTLLPNLMNRRVRVKI